MAEMSPPRRRGIEDLSVRNLAPTTQQSCLHHGGRQFELSRSLWRKSNLTPSITPYLSVKPAAVCCARSSSTCTLL